jgi:hypothetical protein
MLVALHLSIAQLRLPYTLRHDAHQISSLWLRVTFAVTPVKQIDTLGAD